MDMVQVSKKAQWLVKFFTVNYVLLIPRISILVPDIDSNQKASRIRNRRHLESISGILKVSHQFRVSRLGGDVIIGNNCCTWSHARVNQLERR